jgi:hypothetical protein
MNINNIELDITDFDFPDAWVLTTVCTDVPEVEDHNWRATGYLSALRKMEHALLSAGYDPTSGEWRVYEFDTNKVNEIPDEIEVEGADKLIVVLARNIEKLP